MLTAKVKNKTLLRDEVREKIIRMIIENGISKGERLLPEKDLGRLLNVNHLTVRSACAELVEKNVLYKIPGHGTFFNEFPKEGKGLTGEVVGILMLEEEHLYNHVRNQIIQKLQEKNYLCRIQLIPGEGSDQILQYIKEMQQNEVTHLIVMQTELEYSPEAVHFLRENPHAFQTVVRIFGNGVSQEVFPGHQVTLDYELIYRNIIQRLKATGLKKIAYLGADCSPDYRRGMANLRFLSIYFQEMIQAGLENFILVRSTRDDMNEIEKLLTGAERPEAVFCMTDYLAMKVSEKAREIGLKIPDDLSIFGAYDTPWSQHFNLASYRINTLKFAEQVAEAASIGRTDGVEYIDFELIERNSLRKTAVCQ